MVLFVADQNVQALERAHHVQAHLVGRVAVSLAGFALVDVLALAGVGIAGETSATFVE